MLASSIYQLLATEIAAKKANNVPAKNKQAAQRKLFCLNGLNCLLQKNMIAAKITCATAIQMPIINASSGAQFSDPPEFIAAMVSAKATIKPRPLNTAQTNAMVALEIMFYLVNFTIIQTHALQAA
jgi:hypothetical protein